MTTTKHLTISQGRATYRVRPQNAKRLHEALFKLERAKPTKPKIPKADALCAPEFEPGMTTAEYIKRFQQLNGTSGGTPEDVKARRLAFTFADRVAPMLDPSTPEVLEEPDPDYVAPDKPARRVRQTFTLEEVVGSRWPAGARFALVGA